MIVSACEASNSSKISFLRGLESIPDLSKSGIVAGGKLYLVISGV
jgi:hypothetical protein